MINWAVMFVSVSALIVTFVNGLLGHYSRRSDVRQDPKVQYQELRKKYGDQQINVEEYYVPGN